MGSIPIGSATDLPVAGVGRRLAALTYDLLLLAAIWMLVTIAVLAARGGDPVPAGSLPFRLLLLLTAAGFFVGFWVAGGQTPGMRTWRLRIVGRQEGPPDLPTGVIRFAVGLLSGACLGLGLFWLWLGRPAQTWYDRLAGTRVIVLPAQPRHRRG